MVTDFFPRHSGFLIFSAGISLQRVKKYNLKSSELIIRANNIQHLCAIEGRNIKKISNNAFPFLTPMSNQSPCSAKSSQIVFLHLFLSICCNATVTAAFTQLTPWFTLKTPGVFNLLALVHLWLSYHSAGNVTCFKE